MHIYMQGSTFNDIMMYHVTPVLSQYYLLRRFFDHILEVKPNIFVTYNGDSFDW